MKYINKISAAAFATLLLAGCNDLNMQPVGNVVTGEQQSQIVGENPERIYSTVTGIAGMFDAYTQLGDSDDQADFGVPTTFLQLDSRGVDMYCVNAGYNWYLYSMALNDALDTYDEPKYIWVYCYNVISSCNNVLETFAEALENSPSDEVRYLAAQAYAFRGWAYHYLAQMYQFTYVGSEDLLCVPVLTEKNMTESAINGTPCSTVAETYAQIMSDYDNAIDMLTNNSASPSLLVNNKYNRLVSLATAYGLRARANLVMNNWAAAANDAQAAINAFSGQPKSIAQASQPSFNSLDETDWMWGIAVAETDRTVTTGICNFPSMMGSFSYGYATAVGCWKWINTQLYAQIPNSDCRKGWWLNEDGDSPNLTQEQYDYIYYDDGANKIAPSPGTAPGIQVKFAPYNNVVGTSTNASDIPLMRVEEMYLILAEAQGMQSPSQGAQTLTNFVKTYRDPAYTCTAATAQDLQDAVYFQRRIELWGEGLSYLDLLRLKKGINRIGCGFPVNFVYDVQPNDPVMIYPIPNSEIIGNKALTSAVNENRGGQRPTVVQ